MNKEQTLDYWASLEPDEPILPRPIRPDHKGSTYTCDSIRITGSKVYIDSWLGNNKWLLERENDKTRLQITYKETVDKDTGLPTGKYSFYCQVWARSKALNNYSRAIRQEPEITVDLKPMQSHKSLKELANSFL